MGVLSSRQHPHKKATRKVNYFSGQQKSAQSSLNVTPAYCIFSSLSKARRAPQLAFELAEAAYALANTRPLSAFALKLARPTHRRFLSSEKFLYSSSVYKIEPWEPSAFVFCKFWLPTFIDSCCNNT